MSREKLRGILQRSSAQVTRLAALVDSLLDVSRLTAGRLTVAFASDNGFAKKKIENNRGLVLQALRTFTGQSLELRFELRDDYEPEAGAEQVLSGDELFERLKSEFGGTEVFDEEPS